MLGLMQDQPLLISSLIDFAQRHHGDSEIVSRRVEGDIHRTNYAQVGQPEAAVPCVWWCHTYRRRREVDMKPSGAAGARGRRRLPRWMHNVWRILRRSAVDKGREL